MLILLLIFLGLEATIFTSLGRIPSDVSSLLLLIVRLADFRNSWQYNNRAYITAHTFHPTQ